MQRGPVISFTLAASNGCLAQLVADEQLHALKAAQLAGEAAQWRQPQCKPHRTFAMIHAHQKWLPVSFLSFRTSTWCCSSFIIRYRAAFCWLAAFATAFPSTPTHALALLQLGMQPAK